MAKMTDYGNNIAGLRAALRKLPADAKAQLAEASREIAGSVAEDARGKAAGVGGAWAYLAPTFRVTGGAQPAVSVGGARRIPGRKGARQTVGDLTMGLEFGGGARPRTRQFMPHLGTTGYALWPAVREHSDETGQRYSEALLAALESVA